jgi:hypothetical protein
MTIEIGKSYPVTNAFKKSYKEEMTYQKDDSVIKRNIYWRSGTWYITPKNDDEVKKLEDFMDENFDGLINPYEEFLDAEFESSWDGVYEDWETVEGPIDVDDLIEQHEENMEEDEDYEHFDFEQFLEEGMEYELLDTESFFEGTPLKIED